MTITVMVAQFPVTFSIRRNVEAICAVLDQAEAGDLVLFPEGSVSGYSSDLSYLEKIKMDELKDGLDQIQHEALEKQLNVWVGASTYEEGKWFNSALGFPSDGRQLLYHKINLASHERGVFSAGASLPVFVLEMHHQEVRLGIQICRELRFPEQWSYLARQGAQIFLHLNNAVGDGHSPSVWKSHLISRAAETQRFVLSANNAAAKQICPTLAITPEGRVMGEIISSDPGFLRLRIELSQVSDWYLGQSRSDVVEAKPAQALPEAPSENRKSN